jgi:hypothetical protein
LEKAEIVADGPVLDDLAVRDPAKVHRRWAKRRPDGGRTT